MEPPDLPSIDSDESRGGDNPAPRIVEDNRKTFQPEPEHRREYNFFKRGKK
jgi:hypothetical protein